MADVRSYSTPTSLHRYRPLGDKIEQELKAITDSYIYCPAFADMNDPMEGTHRISIRFAMSRQSDSAQLAIAQAQETLGIASLSEVFDHEPMWAHYADKFRGMCIKFNTRRLLRALPGDVEMARMMYSESAPTVLQDATSPIDRAKMSLASKTVRWASEREWRLFRPEIGAAAFKGEQPITKIYLGSRVSVDDERAVRQVARSLGIPVAKMLIDAYKVTFTSDGKKAGK